MWRKGNPQFLPTQLAGMQTSTAIMENSVIRSDQISRSVVSDSLRPHESQQCEDFFKKLKVELAYDPAIPLLGIHSKETRIERDTYTPILIAASFTIARTWKQPRCPSADEWIRKL